MIMCFFDNLLFPCRRPSLLSPRRPGPVTRRDLPGLQCLPATGGGCARRLRSRPAGRLPRGRGLPPLPFPLKNSPYLERNLGPKSPIPRATFPPPRLPTTPPLAQARELGSSEMKIAPKRSYWRGVSQDHFRNLSPNAKNHRFGREIGQTLPEFRHLPENQVMDISIDIPVNPSLPPLKVVLPMPTAKWLSRTTRRPKLRKPSLAPFYPQFYQTTSTKPTTRGSVLPVQGRNINDTRSISLDLRTKYSIRSPEKTIKKTMPRSQVRIKTYYDTIFPKPKMISTIYSTIHPTTSTNSPTLLKLSSQQRLKSNTSSDRSKYASLFTRTPDKIETSEEKPSFTNSTKVSSSHVQSSISASSPEHFSPTKMPKKKSRKKIKGRKFIRYSLPTTESVTDYKEVDDNNKKLLAKSSKNIANEIIAHFKA